MAVTREILIQEAHPSDYERLKDFLERNNTPETTRHFHPFLLTAETAKWITASPELDRYYLALLENQVVGLCMLRGWDEGFTAPSFGVLIDYEFRGENIGKVMTEYAIEEARRFGCKRMRLSVYASNVTAYRLYLSLGFTGTDRETVEVDGEEDERIIMSKEL